MLSFKSAGKCLQYAMKKEAHQGSSYIQEYSSSAPKRRLLRSILARTKLPITDPEMDVESQGLVRSEGNHRESNHRDGLDFLENDAPSRPRGIKGFMEGPFILLLVAVLWGTFTPALKGLYETNGPPTPATLTAVRTTIQAGGLWVVSIILSSQGYVDQPAKSFKPVTRWLVWQAGCEMGFWNFVANSLQAWGLENTTALKGGILIAATSILTPLLAVLAGEWPTVSVWIASIVALGSTILVAADSPSKTSESVYGLISVGDAAVFAAAFFYSVATVRLTHWAQLLPTMKLTSAKSLILASLSIVWLLIIAASKISHGESLRDLWAGVGELNAWLLILWAALGAGATSLYLQTLGQSKASSSEAQVFYSTTPIWSSLLALTFMGETMGLVGWLGGAGLVVAGLLASLEPF